MAKSTFIKDFKAFIAKGNVIDMAVGVVIGAAFGKIVTSFVNDIINPLISLLIGKESLDALVITLREATADTAAVTINIGTFISTVLNFLIIALCIFTALRMMMKIKNAVKKEKPEDEEKTEK